jgi:hypothetical protein
MKSVGSGCPAHSISEDAENASSLVETKKSSGSSQEETLSFLNSLPEIHKPKPKPERSVLDEHLAFLSSLPKASSTPLAANLKVEATPVLEVNEENKPQDRPLQKKKISRKVKRQSQQQLMKEEKNRLEKERAEAKRLEMDKCRREAEEREKRIALEEERARANELAILEEQAKVKPRKKSLLGRLVGA